MNPNGQSAMSPGDQSAAMMGMMNHNHHSGSPMIHMQPQPHSTQIPTTTNTSGGRCCAGCGGKIMDRFLLHAMDRYWHTGCLKCSCCQATLADIGSSCFTKAGMILCKNDYIRMFGNTGACSACAQVIPANEFVMRTHGNVYHLKCFSCVKCRNQLVPGDRYNLVNGSVFCEQDCLKILKGSVSTGGVRKGKVRANSAIKAV
ncbi:LIM domain transcription factor LMO4.2-like [Limulus polyphemus]|uniref:LIM domain transcription factor LMO4.2-like n=1 Tax=Limulus polyphemus TaxID=6850 RepID=A0ABM1TN91_LIMPO|nr:LIM domain transcription factor LMO4.2-like [Limulus polyphemus]